MTDDTSPPTVLTHDESNITPTPSAGSLLREYRQSCGLNIDVLAQVLRVSAAKLEALEADRLDKLPDTVFARALALAVCRHLKTDPAPVLAMLPMQDASRFVPKDERGLDFPLKRPSFLPQTNPLAGLGQLSPKRWMAALAFLFLIVLLLAFGSDIDALFSSNTPATPESVVLAVEPAAEAAVTTSAAASSTASDSEGASPQMVVTTVQSAALASQTSSAAAAAATAASATGASNAR